MQPKDRLQNIMLHKKGKELMNVYLKYSVIFFQSNTKVLWFFFNDTYLNTHKEIGLEGHTLNIQEWIRREIRKGVGNEMENNRQN